MPLYLVEEEVGFDQQLIGFPNLGGCMALVLLTDHGLYGFHITPGNARKSPVFQQFIQSKWPATTGIAKHLYGSCYWGNRYQGTINGMNQKEQWKDEMKQIAQSIGFSGSASGYDTSAWNSHADKTMKTTDFGKSHKGVNYLEYRRDPSGLKCSIFYKKMSKMQTTPGVFNPTDPIRKIIGNNLANPIKNTITTAASVIPTAGNKGEIHEVGYVGLHTFDIP